MSLARPLGTTRLRWVTRPRGQPFRLRQGGFHRARGRRRIGIQSVEGVAQEALDVSDALIGKPHQPLRQIVLEVVMRFPAVVRLPLFEDPPAVPESYLECATGRVVITILGGRGSVHG